MGGCLAIKPKDTKHCMQLFCVSLILQGSWIDGESLVAIHVPAKQILKSTNTAWVPCQQGLILYSC